MAHPGGRPRYQPTDNDRALVSNMAAAGIAQKTMMLCLPDAPKSDKTFARVFQRELATSEVILTARAVSKLAAAVNAGEAWAICFWLKCKANFSELQRREHSGVGGQPIESKTTLEVIYADKTIPE